MNPADHILLAQLLREREAAFVTVWECELRIRRRLGLSVAAEFPFPPPPSLPSQRRQPRPAPATPRLAAATVRRLRPGEDAYRLTCLSQGAPCESLSDAPDVVRALIAALPADLTLQCLDTVALDAAGTPTVVECLWSMGEADHL
jgi:hypothetical protein